MLDSTKVASSLKDTTTMRLLSYTTLGLLAFGLSLGGFLQLQKLLQVEKPASGVGGRVSSGVEVEKEVTTLSSNPNVVVKKQKEKQEALFEKNELIRNNTRISSMPYVNENIYLYHNDSNLFLTEFENCIRDPTCQVFYHHVQKASGTYIGTVLFPWMNTDFPNPIQSHALEGANLIPIKNNTPPLIKSETNNHVGSRNLKGDVFRAGHADVIKTSVKQELNPRRILEPEQGKDGPRHPHWWNLQSEKWCCFEPLMERIRYKPRTYCRYKFASFEVSATEFNEILNICLYDQSWRQQDIAGESSQDQATNSAPAAEQTINDPPQDENYPFKRAVVLLNYREPVARTLSLIHQLCNDIQFPQLVTNQIHKGNWDSLQLNKTAQAINEFINACHRCSYQGEKPDPDNSVYRTDADFWDHLVRDANRMMEGVKEILDHVEKQNVEQRQQTSKAQDGPRLASSFMIDTASVSSFVKGLNERFPDKPLPEGSANERRPYRVCHFDMDTAPEMVLGLSPGIELYRALSVGKF